MTDSSPVTGSHGGHAPFEPHYKGCKDIYEGSPNDVKAIENLSYGELTAAYPMLCYCEPGGPIKPCAFCKDGHRGRLPSRRKLLWAWPVFGWFAMKYLKVGYMKKFYADDYPKASLGVIAFSSVLSVLIDAFTDPRMATWTDSCESRYGRRRPFIVFSAVFVPIIFVLSWVPAIVEPGIPASIWFGVFHCGYKLCDTVFNIPLQGWGAQLTPLYKEKTTIWVWHELFANLGVMLGMAIMPLIFVTKQCQSTPDDGCTELPYLTAAFALIYVHGCLQLAWYGKEPASGLLERVRLDGEQEHVSHGKGFTEWDTVPVLISSFFNKPFRILLVTDIAKAVGQEIPFNVMPFMTAWVIGEKCFPSDDFFGYLVAGNLSMAFLFLVPWMWCAARIGKYKAFMGFNITLALSTFSFILLAQDDGSCTGSIIAFVLVCFFGASYCATFLLKDIVSDVIDYDELLTGGQRREASYMMAVEFIPKFMNIPGECVPFLLMAHYNYARPLPSGPDHRPTCMGTTGSDMFCQDFYRNETFGQNLCSDLYTCAEYISNGVSFVCNNAHKECGVMQSESVQWVLKMSFSIVPCFFICLGIVALCFYPVCARTEIYHEKLLEAITKLRRGETVEDPWRPGSWVVPAPPPTANQGTLSYFTPNELKGALEGQADKNATKAEIGPLVRWPAILAFLFAILLPVGAAIVSSGMEDLFDDLGASVSPLGLMIFGIGLLGTWFHGARARAAWSLKATGLTCDEMRQKYNAYCPFIGKTRMKLSSDTEAVLPAAETLGLAAVPTG